MNLLIVHRNYRHKGGEDFFLENALLPALDKLQIPYILFRLPALFSQDLVESLAEISFMALGLETWRPSYFRLKKIIRQNPHLSHALLNNCVPTVSLKTAMACKKKGLKPLMWVHNARAYCANGLLFNGKTPCNKCVTQGSRQAFLQNCYQNSVQSFIYALVYRFRRVSKILARSVDLFICPSEYTATNLQKAMTDISPIKTVVIHHPLKPLASSVKTESKPSLARVSEPFYLFLGRVSHEKGADIFLNLARKYPASSHVVAGEGPMLETLKKKSTPNVIFLGQVGELEKRWLFENAKALVICSRVPENAPMVIFESHPYGLPVVYSEGGGAEEMVKFLKRTGSPLSQFTGQNFERTVSQISDTNSYEVRLKELLT